MPYQHQGIYVWFMMTEGRTYTSKGCLGDVYFPLNQYIQNLVIPSLHSLFGGKQMSIPISII